MADPVVLPSSAQALTLEDQALVASVTALLLMSPGRGDSIAACLRLTRQYVNAASRSHPRVGPIAEAAENMLNCRDIEDPHQRRTTYGRHAATARAHLSNLYLWRAGQAENRIEELADVEAHQAEMADLIEEAADG